MTRIAHISDLHLLEDDPTCRQRAARLRLAYLALGCRAGIEQRRRQAARALEQAWRTGADHLVITGDLTEDGVDAQFEVLATLLTASPWHPSEVTLVPGNHDEYAASGAWERALGGPLASYAATSTPGAITHLKGAAVIAISTAFHQPVTRAAGAIGADALASIERLALETRASGAAVVIAQHHPPQPRAIALLDWVDGLSRGAELAALLAEHDHTHVVHGHTHTARDRSVRSGSRPRIFSTEAVAEGDSPLRVYRVERGRLIPETGARCAAPERARIYPGSPGVPTRPVLIASEQGLS